LLVEVRCAAAVAMEVEVFEARERIGGARKQGEWTEVRGDTGWVNFWASSANRGLVG
jgi:phytoene dehydrogenase-like protein